MFQKTFLEKLRDKPVLTDGEKLDKWTENKPALQKEFEMWSNKRANL